MEKIILNRIIKENNVIKYDFSVSDGLSKYFSGKPFIIEYQEDITCVPDSIAAVPFVCNVLPIIWLTDSELVLDDLDKAFLECIPEVRKGYEDMFPESRFLGKLCVQNIVDGAQLSTNQSGLFFSGGLDAVSSLVSHITEKPDLISIWGSDVRYDNVDGWNNVQESLLNSAKAFNLELLIIKSSFRKFDYEDILSQDFAFQLKDSWWHGIKHGLGLIGHVAPLSYIRNYTTVYIASSFCAEDKSFRCASSPTIDNFVRFCGCRIVHDGFELSRQDKARNVAMFHRKEKIKIPLRVCWRSQKGDNCCECEKCYRTIMELISECEDPARYGFDYLDKTMPIFRQRVVEKNMLDDAVIIPFWIKIKERLLQNKRLLRRTKYWKHIKWLTRANMEDPKTIKFPLKYRLRMKLAEYKFYQKLHFLKVHKIFSGKYRL